MPTVSLVAQRDVGPEYECGFYRSDGIVVVVVGGGGRGRGRRRGGRRRRKREEHLIVKVRPDTTADIVIVSKQQF